MKGIHNVSTKKFTGAGLAIGAATAVTAMLIGSTAAYADPADGVASAFGVSAEGTLLNIDPTPLVVSEDGELVEDEAADLEIAALLEVAAEAGRASANVTGVDVEGVLTADVVRTFCEDGQGGLQIVNGELLGQELPNDPIRGEEIDLSPLARVTLGEETRNADDSVTVTGIKLEILPVTAAAADDPLGADNPLAGALPDDDDTVGGLLDGLGIAPSETLQTVIIGSATCGDDGRDDDDDNGDDGRDDDDDNGDDGRDDDDDNGVDNGCGVDDGKKDDGVHDDKNVDADKDHAVDEKKDDQLKTHDDKDNAVDYNKDGSSSCDDDKSDDVVADDDHTEAAPAPTVVQANLPVTG